MYIPEAYREDRLEVLLDVVNKISFGTLITASGGTIQTTQVPFVVMEHKGQTYLAGHLARANDQWKNYQTGDEAVANIIAADAYISPNWYPSKQETGKVVPTWNYVAVECRSPLILIEDTTTLLKILDALTDHHESSQPRPWATGDAPADYIEGLTKAIVGFLMPTSNIRGCWKLNQKKRQDDYLGTVQGLREDGAESEIATFMESRLHERLS
jgi:transcriptional regulator